MIQEDHKDSSVDLESVHKDRLYFDQILQLIPPAHYFSDVDLNNATLRQGKYGKWKKDRPDKKNSLKKERKEKRQESLNPDKVKTITEMQKEKKEKEEQETSVVKEISLFTLGKRKREGSGLDNDAKERLRNKIQELREKRNAPEKKKQKVERNSEEETEKRLADNVKNSISESMISADSGEEMEDLNFGTFDYSDGKAKPAYLNTKKNTKATYSLLKKVEEEKKQMESLKKTKEGLEEVREKKMELALRKVQGEKIKDDPSKIRKTLKRKERQATKSREKAADRKRTQKMEQARRIKQREDNIRARAAAKKANKGKRGKPRPGFEGKKKGFINK